MFDDKTWVHVHDMRNKFYEDNLFKKAVSFYGFQLSDAI